MFSNTFDTSLAPEASLRLYLPMQTHLRCVYDFDIATLTQSPQSSSETASGVKTNVKLSNPELCVYVGPRDGILRLGIGNFNNCCNSFFVLVLPPSRHAKVTYRPHDQDRLLR